MSFHFKATKNNTRFIIEENPLNERNAERRGQVVNTPTSYSGGPGFKSLPEDWISFLTELFRDFL
jgi:hypothetical protein